MQQGWDEARGNHMECNERDEDRNTVLDRKIRIHRTEFRRSRLEAASCQAFAKNWKKNVSP